MIQCQIQWIDENGKPTPDQNKAIAFAHFHVPVFGPNGKITQYKDEIQDSYAICEEHLRQVTSDMLMPSGGWEFKML